jgi:ABC-type dipeptide/oligopeptide/nickel transport system ATPase component
MVEDDIEGLPPLPYEEIQPEANMPDMGKDESEIVKPDDWDKFDMDIITDEGIAQTRGGGSFDGSKITTFKWQDKRFAVPQRWYWGNIVKRMLNHNKAHGFTGCVLIGMSGSGKTTLTNTILHKIHEYGENYVFKWFNGHQLTELDKHIDKLQVGVPHVMVFDDASYTMEDATKTQMAKLANALTTIRHKTKSKVIIVFNIHYSRATKKFFRNQHFTFLTSVTTEELGNLKDLFQDKMPVVRQFGKKYRQMALNGSFYVPLDYYTGKSAKYVINEPFRIGLVSEITDLHFFLYPRSSCELCRPGAPPKLEIKTVKQVKSMLKKYKNQTALMTTLAFWCKTHNIGPVDPLEHAHKSYWNFFEKVSRDVKAPWQQILNELRDESPRRTRMSKGTQMAKNVDAFGEVMKPRGPGRPRLTPRQISEREHKHETESPEDYVSTSDTIPVESNDNNDNDNNEYPDYDSTYVRPPEGSNELG